MLQGSFDTVSLDEVLGFLASSSKTGVLRISGDRGTGAVWVEDGQMVAAETTVGGDESSIEEVVFELLRFSTGTFAFEFDETNPNASAPREVENVLTQANKLLVEWRSIELVVPGLDYRITPTPSLPADQVTVTTDEWTTLLAIGSNASVEQVVNELNIGQIDGFRRLKGLIERKIVLITDPQADQLLKETEMDAVTADKASDGSKASAGSSSASDNAVSGKAVSDKAVLDKAVLESAVSDDAAPLTFEAPEVASVPAIPDVPPPVAPSARRLSAKRAEVAPRPKPATDAPTSVFDAPTPPVPAAPAPAPAPAPKVEESMSDPFADSEVRPPAPPPPPMPSAPVPAAPAVSAEVPPPPAPPSPAEIAKFGTSVEDASTIDEALVESTPEPSAPGESSLLMRYLQSEG